MLCVRCTQKFRDKHGIIIGYEIENMDNNDKRRVEPKRLKELILSKQVIVVNLTLTSDNRLIDKTETNNNTEKIDRRHPIYLTNDILRKCARAKDIIVKSNFNGSFVDRVKILGVDFQEISSGLYMLPENGNIKLVAIGPIKLPEDCRGLFDRVYADYIDFSGIQLGFNSKAGNIFGNNLHIVVTDPLLKIVGGDRCELHINSSINNKIIQDIAKLESAWFNIDNAVEYEDFIVLYSTNECNTNNSTNIPCRYCIKINKDNTIVLSIVNNYYESEGAGTHHYITKPIKYNTVHDIIKAFRMYKSNIENIDQTKILGEIFGHEITSLIDTIEHLENSVNELQESWNTYKNEAYGLDSTQTEIYRNLGKHMELKERLKVEYIDSKLVFVLMSYTKKPLLRADTIVSLKYEIEKVTTACHKSCEFYAEAYTSCLDKACNIMSKVRELLTNLLNSVSCMSRIAVDKLDITMDEDEESCHCNVNLSLKIKDSKSNTIEIDGVFSISYNEWHKHAECFAITIKDTYWEDMYNLEILIAKMKTVCNNAYYNETIDNIGILYMKDKGLEGIKLIRIEDGEPEIQIVEGDEIPDNITVIETGEENLDIVTVEEYEDATTGDEMANYIFKLMQENGF